MGSSNKVDFAEGLLVFREQMGIRTNGNLSQFSLLTCVQMGSHLFAKVLYADSHGMKKQIMTSGISPL